MLSFDNFDWGNLSKNEIEFFQKESTESYIRFFDVEQNDVVVDIGAFVGSFTYSILDKNPQHVWVMEPIKEHFKTLYKNLKNHQVSFTRAGISDDKEIDVEWAGVRGKNAQGIKFKDFIENNCIDKIDFFKCDCEGGEYLIFNNENINYITQNIKKIACEFHLSDTEKKEKFKHFRDNILQQFDTYYVFSIDGVDIKWDLFNEHFIEYYSEVIFLIDNRNYNNIEEQRFWNNSEEWSREGDEWSDVFGGTDKTWNEIIYPKIKDYFGETLEIAPGHGRITNYLLKNTNNLSIVDLNENCINSCKDKFGDKIINYIVNNGKSLEFFENNSMNFVFSWDSFVHMDRHVIKNYLNEIYRILKINGVGYIHHSFFNGDIESKKNIAGRSNMNPDLFKELCQEAGLEIISQEDLIGNVTDTISIFRKNESTL